MKTDFVEIFQTIRAVIQPYTVNGFTATNNTDTEFELATEKAVDIDGGEKDNVYFAGVKIHDNHVGFYYMPINLADEMKNLISKDLLHLHNGESHFAITELDDELLEKISEALAVGATFYKQKEWA